MEGTVNSQALILMTRVPVPGKTKTRLMPHLSAEECAGFHEACLKDIIKVQRELKKPANIFYSEKLTEKFMTMFPKESQFISQEGDNLGERMSQAFRISLQDYKFTLMVGSDLPHLTVRLLQSAFEALEQHDVVLGPALDGGYYLIGLKQFIPDLFTGITWGSSEVFRQTIERVHSLGLSYRLLQTMQDLDTIEDLRVYMRNPANKDHQAWKYIDQLGGVK
ncbi:MAG: TIGR04282 family arsenosugar biosynthesis glycosyltransferase [Desulfosporosinus sp.]|nr:TIGR04282 family arsenosugar biosynthesis glycosyltransferase [Desulfosporosinus sp.]